MVVVDVSTLLAEGLAAHQTGQLHTAEACYRRALTAQPEHPDALHLLAIMLLQSGRAREAQAFALRATSAAPTQPTFWNTRGVVAQGAGRHEEAVNCFAQAVKLAPGYTEGWSNLAIACAGLGRPADELAALERLTAIEPGHGSAWGRRGVLALDTGAAADAADYLARAVALLPDEADLWCSLGNAQFQIGHLEEAEASQRRAIALRPGFVAALNNLGNVLVTARRWEEAHAALEQVVALASNHEHGWTNLGFALRGLGRAEESRAAFERALAIQPDLPLALIGLGDAYQGLRDYPKANAAYERASRVDPGNADLWKHYAVALQHDGRLQEAADAYRRCLDIDPSRHDVGIALIFALDMLSTSLEEANAARRAWNDRHARPLAHLIQPHANDTDPERRLRIGFVSSDLRRHSVATCMLGIMEHHDPAVVEIVCYSNNPTEDDYTARFKAVAARWRQVEAMTDEELAAQIRGDEIDILVDLSGFSSGTRLLTFARKPAPVQVTAWGYATGTGLDAMDAYFSDPVLVPPHEEQFYAERVVHLPNVLCYTPPPTLPPITPLPALEQGIVTFGSYNRAIKITAEVLETWARIMNAVPGSRLLLKPGTAETDEAREVILGPLARNGIARERVEILSRSGNDEHLFSFGRMDIHLDPFPHAGGITTMDGLLMGVPSVTLLTERPSGRSSASFLTTLGLTDLVATSVEEYVEIAVRLAGDTARLADERTALRDRLLASPMGDPRQYVQHVEQAYRALWRDWCSGKLSRSPAVSTSKPQAPANVVPLRPRAARGAVVRAARRPS